jgi:hypothetical protein
LLFVPRAGLHERESWFGFVAVVRFAKHVVELVVGRVIRELRSVP